MRLPVWPIGVIGPAGSTSRNDYRFHSTPLSERVAPVDIQCVCDCLPAISGVEGLTSSHLELDHNGAPALQKQRVHSRRGERRSVLKQERPVERFPAQL